jgi:DNA-binding MarR family transcriptional regulator
MKPDTGNDVVDAILHAAHRIRTSIDGDLRAIGLSLSTYKVLRALAPGSRSMREVSELLRVAPRTVTDLVDTLEARAMVRRRAHPDDGRVTLLELTEDGASSLARAREHAQRGHERAVKSLTVDEQQSLRTLLENVG